MRDVLLRGRRAPRRRGGVAPLRGLLVLGVGLATWQLIGNEDSPYFPPPSTWVTALEALWRDDVLGPALGATVKTFLLAFLLAVLIGTGIGIMVGRSRVLDRTLGPLFEFWRVIPPAAVVPIVVLFSGYTERMKLVVVLFAAIWPVLLQVRTTARTIDRTLLDVARSLRLSRRQTMWKVMSPAIAPGVIAGANLAAPTILVVVLLVEVVTQIEGIGGLIQVARQNFQSDEVYGLILVAGVLALAVNMLVTSLESIAIRRKLLSGHGVGR